MTILDGPKTLIRNALFPAGYVLLGNIESLKNMGNFCVEQLKTLPWNTNTTAWVESGSNITSALWSGCTLDNAKTFGNNVLVYPISSAYQSITSQSSVGAFSTASTILSDHYWTIGTAAALGVSFTLINAVLKRTPMIKQHPYFRAATSIGLSAVATYYGANALQLQKVTPEMITEIAEKVLVIGAIFKVATVATRVAATAARESSDWISWAFRGGCNVVIFTANSLNWGGLPEGPKVVEKKKAKMNTDVDRKENVREKTPGKVDKPPVNDSARKRTPAKKVEEGEEGDGAGQPLKTPPRGSAVKAKERIAEIAEEERQVAEDGEVVAVEGEVVEHNSEE
jgi:hypothetical protein